MPNAYEAWDSPVPSGILGKLWLSGILHGDLYPYDKFVDEACDFYDRFYGIQIDKEALAADDHS
jgi:iron complex transport system substrate-binding protein